MQLSENTLPLEKRRRLAQLVREETFRGACTRLNTTAEVLARLIAGIDVRRGTLFAAAAAIDALPPATVTATPPDPIVASLRPSWLDTWADKYLTGEQRAAFERVLAKNAPNWSRR